MCRPRQAVVDDGEGEAGKERKEGLLRRGGVVGGCCGNGSV